MVDAALAAAKIDAGEDARLSCAKALMRLAPAGNASVKPEDYGKALRDIGLG